MRRAPIRYSGRQIFDGLRQTRAQMEGERAQWSKLAVTLKETVDQIPREIDAAWQQLGEVAIPVLDVKTLDEAAARLALPQIAARAVAAQRDADRRENEARIAAIAREPMFAEREARRNAAEIRLAEAEEPLKLLVDSVTSMRNEPFFEELLNESYGTEEYAHKFWQVSFYRHWKFADVILEKHGKRLGVADFGALRHKHLDERDAIPPLEAARGEQQEALRKIAQLEQAHAQATQALKNLDARALAWARGRVREHLSSLPPDEMTRLLQAAPELRVAGARVLGLTAKKAYLVEIAKQQVRPFDEEWRQVAADLDARIMKMSRPKKWREMVDEETYLKRTGAKRLDKWKSRRTHVSGASNTIIGFNRYDSYDPVRDYLWWNVMTGGRYDMPVNPTDTRSAVLWGADDDAAHFAAAEASARSRELRDDSVRDFS